MATSQTAIRNIRSGGGVGEIRSSASISCRGLCLGFPPAQKRSIYLLHSYPLLLLLLLIHSVNAPLNGTRKSKNRKEPYREISVWLSSLKPSPSRTDVAQSVSSTWSAKAANPRGCVRSG